MNSLFHCRKISLAYNLQHEENEDQKYKQLGFVRSLKQSPQSGSLFWLLKSTQNNTSRCQSGQKQRSKSKIHKKLSQQSSKVDHNCYTNSNHAIRSLQKISNLSLQSCLYIVQSALRQCSLIHNKLGQSYFSIKNCYLNQQNKLIIRLDNPYTQSYIANSNQTIIVRDIVEAVHKICYPKLFDDFYYYYKRASIKNKCDYKYAMSLIRSYCMCSKISVADRIDWYENQEIEKRSHPRSAQKISSPFKQPVPTLKRKSYTKGYRESMTTKFSETLKKEFNFKDVTKKQKNIFNSGRRLQTLQPQHIGIYKTSSKLKTCRTLSNQNSIQLQFNLTLKPTLSQGLPLYERNESKIKQSTVSTNFKSSLHNGDSIQSSSIILASRLVGSTRIQNLPIRQNQNRQYLSYLPRDLDEVQSLGQSSDLDLQNQSPQRCYETPRDAHQQQIKKQNQQRILTINNWTRKVNDLLGEQTELKRSFIQGSSHRDLNKIQHQNQHQHHTKVLGKMARTITQSILPIPSQFLLKHA